MTELGYLYRPRIDTVTKWTSTVLLQDTSAFVKIALVREASPNHMRPLYVNASIYPAIDPENFVPPHPWTVVGSRTEEVDNYLVTFSVIENSAEVVPSGGITGMSVMPESNSFFNQDEEVLSTMDLFTDSGWDPTNDSFSMSEIHSLPHQPVMQHDPMVLMQNTFPSVTSAIIPQYEGVFVNCSPADFALGDSILQKLGFVKANLPMFSRAIKDARVLAKHHLTINGQYSDAFYSICYQSLTETVTRLFNDGWPVERGLRCSETMNTIEFKFGSGEIMRHVLSVQRFFEQALKESAVKHADKREHNGGYGLVSMDIGAARGFITDNTGMEQSDSIVTRLTFTCDAMGRPYRRGAILLPLASRIIRNMHGYKMSLLDFAPDDYQALPEVLMADICAYLVICFRSFLPGGNLAQRWPGADEIQNEQRRQLVLLRDFRAGSTPDAIAFNEWMRTRDGADGWLVDLKEALEVGNRMRGPLPRSGGPHP